jgi:predicted amidophosphoribosyltransferase
MKPPKPIPQITDRLLTIPSLASHSLQPSRKAFFLEVSPVRNNSQPNQSRFMALKINPIAIKGSWTQGWALDLHTLSSTFIGDDAYGHPHFENKRSELGELLFQFKYRGDRSGLAAICETVAAFVRQRNFTVDLIATVPPSNESRRIQPLPAIARGVSERLSCAYRPDALVKVRQTDELKTVYDLEQRRKLLQGVFRAVPQILEGRNVLLLDDLFRSGATMNEAARQILENGRAKSLVAITLTKTRSNR